MSTTYIEAYTHRITINRKGHRRVYHVSNKSYERLARYICDHGDAWDVWPTIVVVGWVAELRSNTK